LGGGIELGEHSRDTILREIREELGAVVTNLVPLGVVESIFMYLGKQRHEIVFVYDGQFEDASLYDRELLSVVEGDDCFEAQWLSLSDFQQGIERLVPEQLLEVLTSYQGHGYAWR
jgi:8-oxo-dGTP pyrophosphatase MutT (NUDIX family)